MGAAYIFEDNVYCYDNMNDDQYQYGIKYKGLCLKANMNNGELWFQTLNENPNGIQFLVCGCLA